MLLRAIENIKDECSSSASTEGVGDRKEALVLDGLRGNLGLVDEGASWRGTCVTTVRAKRTDDEVDHEDGMKSSKVNKPSSTINRLRENVSAATSGPLAIGGSPTPTLTLVLPESLS